MATTAQGPSSRNADTAGAGPAFSASATLPDGDPAMLSPEDRTRSCATELVCRDCGRRYPLHDTAFKCHGCGNGLDIDYDYELAKERLAEIPPGEREINIWRFEELLPIVDARALARVGRYSGRTPLIHADRLGAELGLKQASTSRTTRPRARRSPTRTASSRWPSPACSSWARRRSAASRPATSAPRSPRWRPRPGSPPTSSTRPTWRRARPAPAGRSAPP